MPCMLPVGLLKLVNNHLHWHIDVTRDGKHVAFLQDQDLEIRYVRTLLDVTTFKVVLLMEYQYPTFCLVAIEMSKSCEEPFIENMYILPIYMSDIYTN